MAHNEQRAGSDDCYLGVDWNYTAATTTLKIAPTVWRWDRYNTANTGGRWWESLYPEPDGHTGGWTGLSWGTGSGWRKIDTFAERTYNRTKSKQTIHLDVGTDSSFGTYNNGFNYIGAITRYWTLDIDPLPSYAVTFDANSGSGAPSAQTKWYGEDLTLSSTKPTRTGYTFKGWATTQARANAGTVDKTAGAKYTTNAAQKFWAVWQINTYTISYNANGGSGTTASQTKNYGATITVRANSFTRTNYVFKNWNTKADGSGTTYVANQTQYSTNANLALYAQWYAPYTVSYNANGGSGAPSAQTKIYGQTLTLSSTIPTMANHDFLGWATSSTATSATYCTGTNHTTNNTYSTNAALSLYAVWKVSHANPTISSLVVQRCVEDASGNISYGGKTYALAADGELCYVTGTVSVDNTTMGFTDTKLKSVTVQVGTNAAETVSVSTTATSASISFVSANAVARDSTYKVTLTVVDSHDFSSFKTSNISRAFFTMHFREGGDGVGIGTPSLGAGFLDIGMTPRLIPNANGWAGIRFKNPLAETGYSGINFYADPNANGDAALFGAGGMTIVGAGESSTNWYQRITGSDDPRWNNRTQGDETLWLTSDNNVVLVSNANTPANRKVAVLNNSGNFVFSEDTVDVTTATNGVSANLYRSFGALDGGDRYYFFCEGCAQTDGRTAATLAARNYGTGSAVNNALNLYVNNDGTRSVSFTSATPWLNALFFWGQMVGLSASQTLTTSAAKMPLSTFAGNGCSASSNGLKVTNAGTYLVWGSLYLTTGYTAGDLIHIKAYRNSTAVSDWIFRAYSASHYSTPHFGPIAVTCSANDVLYLYAYNQTAARGVVGSSATCGLRILRVS